MAVINEVTNENLVQTQLAWDIFFREISSLVLNYAKLHRKTTTIYETCKEKRAVDTPTHKAPKRNRKILLPLFAITFMKINGHFVSLFLSFISVHSEKLTQCLKLSSINISLEMNMEHAKS